jgi:hypothetical protein
MKSNRSRVPAPPNSRGRFPPSKRELDEGSLPGIACGIRTRVPTLKEWCPGPSRRTRHVWCPRRRLLAVLGLRPVAVQRPDRLRRSEQTRGLPLTRRLLCLLSYKGLCSSTSAVPKRERPVGRGDSLHVAGPRPRTSRGADTPLRGRGVHGHTRSGADDELRTRGPDRHGAWRDRALPTELHPQSCKTNHRPVPRSSRSNLLKSVHRERWCDPSIAGLACA